MEGDHNKQHFFPEGLGVNLSEDLGRKVMHHRNTFRKFFVGRYLESLATLFFYDIPYPFDKIRLEIALRCGYAVVFGKNKFGDDVILGYVTDNFQHDQPYIFFNQRRFSGEDIIYTIPKEARPTGKLLEIVNYDHAKTGDFVVFHNKYINYTSDLKIIEHYADELAEIVASQFSLIVQSKVTTFFVGQPGNETINQIVSDIYNGSPFVKVSNYFDPEENIVKMENSDIAGNLQELKEEYQNKIAELNSSFGVNILSVNKQSGVTDSEANGNLSYVRNNGNIWLQARQQALDLYNARFGKDYKVHFDDESSGLLDEDSDGKGDAPKPDSSSGNKGKADNEDNDDDRRDNKGGSTKTGD